MKSSLGFLGSVFILSTALFSARGAEASIDSLLKKLPPPEKLVKAHVEQALADPALKDPLARNAVSAADSGNYSKALGLARQLTQKDPNSAFAHILLGALAMEAKQYSEADSAL